MVIKLDIGCGNACREGYIGMDIAKFSKDVKIIVNLEKQKIPCKDNSVDEIYCAHVLEHLNNPIEVLDEFNRILKPGGKLIIRVPYFADSQANVPMHKNYWSCRCKMFFDNSYFEMNSKWKSVSMEARFASHNFLAKMIDFPFEFLARKLGLDIYERYFCYLRPFYEIKFEVIK
jgi:predicted SAM-dependent methyltransferase